MIEKRFVFDTSAIFTFSGNEPGVERVEQILLSARKRECGIYLSFASLAELYYISCQKSGRSTALDLIALVKSLPLSIVESNERLSLFAGTIEAAHRLSFADAFVAATAAQVGGVLIHKDPEFEQVGGLIALEPLPYKEKKAAGKNQSIV